jgi:hypothetical protein
LVTGDAMDRDGAVASAGAAGRCSSDLRWFFLAQPGSWAAQPIDGHASVAGMTPAQMP